MVRGMFGFGFVEEAIPLEPYSVMMWEYNHDAGVLFFVDDVKDDRWSA